jgi:hypothetical protein
VLDVEGPAPSKWLLHDPLWYAAKVRLVLPGCTVVEIPNYRREVLPHHIEPYQAEATRQPQGEFEARYPYPFLIYTRSALWDRGLLLAAEARGGSDTQIVRYELYEGGMTFLHPIRKLQSDPRHPGIVLGRAMTQDMVVPIASISSAHAVFTPPQRSAAAWTVTDLGSKNGTWLEEDQLPAREPRAIHDGECLRLGGNLIAWFFSPGPLWGVLRRPGELRKYTEP